MMHCCSMLFHHKRLSKVNDTLLMRFAGLTLSLLALVSCAVTPPVQEMSDARQAISAAREANATDLAPATLQEAERSLDEAARGMEQGHYLDARESAKAARRHAIRARDEALSTPSNN